MPQTQALAGSVAGISRAAALAACYFFAAKLSLLAAIPPGYATAVWPPSGIALAALLIFGRSSWPGIFLGAALVNVTVQSSPVAALVMGAGNTLEALAGAALLARVMRAPRVFESGQEVSWFVAIAFLSAAVAASVAALPLYLVHSLPAAELAWNWWTWWQGDAMGIILVTPLILGFHSREQLRWTPPRVVEGAALAAALLVTSYLVFGDNAAPYAPVWAVSFLILPSIMWAAVRFRQREVATLIATVCVIALYFTVKGSGPFAARPLDVSLLLLLAFVSAVAACGLMLNAVVGERSRAMASLLAAVRQLSDQAATDALTGLYNRRFLEDYLAREVARSVRRRGTLALLMIDLDHFKRVNDRSGHAAGDAVLRMVAALLRTRIRAGDVACRYGGEEFLVILPEATAAHARERAEEIRAGFERGRESLSRVTVSIGVALYPGDGATPDVLLKAADRALYEAKAAGRNRVVLSRGG